MTTEKQVEKGISEYVGALTDPIMVFPGGWGEELPQWLKDVIPMERLAMNMKALKGEEMTGTDAEACAYLYTASLTAPMDHDWAQIYCYLVTHTVRQWRPNEMPSDVRVDSLDENQMAELRRLKDWIYHKRVKGRLERDRSERRQKKEEEAARRKVEQPALFEF